MEIFQKFPNFFQQNNGGLDGVVVIDQNGVLVERYLDEMPYNHATLTNYISLLLKLSYFETDSPYLAGINLAGKNCVVLQLHKDGTCICYFPDKFLKVQCKVLTDFLDKKTGYVQFDSFYQLQSFPGEGFMSKDEFLIFIDTVVYNETKNVSKVLKNSNNAKLL